MTEQFKRFDRELEDFRSAVANANVTVRGAVERYVNMMHALDTAFTLFYADLPDRDKAIMKAAFAKLADAVGSHVGEKT